jgi:hypothetical protein
MFLFISYPLDDPHKGLALLSQQLPELFEEFENGFAPSYAENHQLLRRSNARKQIYHFVSGIFFGNLQLNES